MGLGNRLTNDVGLVGELFTRKIRMDTSSNLPITEEGQMVWDPAYETVDVLLSNGSNVPVKAHLGQDTFYYVKADATITRGQVVYAHGTEGASGHILARPYLANGTYDSRRVLGLAAKDAATGDFFHVLHFGQLRTINTATYTAGQILFASPTVAGGLTGTLPTAPNNIVTIAFALNSKANGTLAVRPTFGEKLSENEEVRITDPQDGDVLKYNGATGLWENAQP